MDDTIYIKANIITHNYIEVNIETLLILNIYNVCNTDEVKLKIIQENSNELQFKVFIKKYDVVFGDEVPSIANYCVWPVIVVANSVVAGLCSVSRQIIKSSNNENVLNLLGFREACLIACSESSIWTKFCEIDMTRTVKDVITNFDNYTDEHVQIPIDLIRFEYHMEQPVRIHNVYKVARVTNNDKDIKSSVPLKDLNIPHCYSEGPYLTLSDVILYPCIKILLDIFEENLTRDVLPLTYTWFKNMLSENLLIINFEPVIKCKFLDKCPVIHPDIPRQSLYTSDPNRYKPQNRIFTKQPNIESALDLIKTLEIKQDVKPYGHEIDFDWKDIPIEASPEGGALPKKRAKRKSEQLLNLAKAVMKVAKDKRYKIVDFCSGSGHLGIILAVLLPQCEIILVENKERSLQRAKATIAILNLTNIVVLQSNLDYFIGKFDLGVSLHACGVATDLVIQNCIVNKAHFVSCPCCYGGIHDCYHMKFPRSDVFCDFISDKDYFNIAHAADQAHGHDNVKTKQGFFCMDVIDTDRKLYAEQVGYDVSLGKLLPLTCTPKHNLLVGIYKGRND